MSKKLCRAYRALRTSDSGKRYINYGVSKNGKRGGNLAKDNGRQGNLSKSEGFRTKEVMG
nr:MAG TPA: hypothetical protein [Caudoviricetes sp.]